MGYSYTFYVSRQTVSKLDHNIHLQTRLYLELVVRVVLREVDAVKRLIKGGLYDSVVSLLGYDMWVLLHKLKVSIIKFIKCTRTNYW